MACALPPPALVYLFFSFFLDWYPVPPGQLLLILGSKIWPLEPTWPAVVETGVFQVRLPRVLAAMAAGAALSTAGAAYQGMFRNPLVSPDILGASAGACFGAALAIYLSLGVWGIQITSFLCGLLAVSLAFWVSTRVRQDPVLALVLAGILIGTLFSSATSLIKYIADPYDKLPAITFWLMGSLGRVSAKDLAMVLFPVLVGMLPLYLLRWRLNVLSLGEEEARALGLNTGRLRLMVILCATLMTSATVAVSGIIGWVGLIVPHLARMVVGPNYRELLPASILMGSTYLLLVDDLARTLTTAEMPLSVLTSLIGAPFFLLYSPAPEEGVGMKLEVKDLACGYRRRPVIQGVSCSGEPGEVLCLLGPNGSGKTTLFKTLLGLLHPHRGRVLIEGEDIHRWPRERLAQVMGYVPQSHVPPFPFKVLDVVLMGRTPHLGPLDSPGPRDMELAHRALAVLGISHLADRPYTEISGGKGS